MNQTAGNDNYNDDEPQLRRTAQYKLIKIEGQWDSVPIPKSEQVPILKDIRRAPETLKPRKGVTIRMSGDGPVKAWTDTKDAIMATLPANDSKIIPVRAWPTATRYIRSMDGERAKGLAAYASANDDLAAAPVAANDNWRENEKHISRLSDDLNTDCLDEYRPSPEELMATLANVTFGQNGEPARKDIVFEQPAPGETATKNIRPYSGEFLSMYPIAGKVMECDGLKFGPRSDFGGKWGLIKWRGSDGVWRKPWESYRQPKGGKDQVEEIADLTEDEIAAMSIRKREETAYNKRIADNVRESNIWLEELMSTQSSDMPPAKVFPEANRLADDETHNRMAAVTPVAPKRALHTTTIEDKETGRKKQEPWTYEDYEAALAAFTGTIRKCPGPVMPRRKNGDRQNNFPGLHGIRKNKQSKSQGGGTLTWEDRFVERIDHRRLKARMDDDTRIILELATTDAKAEEIGEALGYHGKYAQRRGVAAVDEAIDTYLVMAA
ncbi:hypothetical protein [Phyllobacterium bourgognense]|nr:hypothetical protein [Phyllobacterium bourgognense]